MTWTIQHIRKRVSEAFQTLDRLPNIKGPSQYGSAMPEPVRAISEAYGYDKTIRVRIPPTGKDIAEMEETWDWINALPNRDDRIECFRYGWIKTRKGMSFAAYLEKNDIHRRNYERRIGKIFQVIADKQNSIPKIRNQAPGLQVSQNLTHERSVKQGKSRSSSWMAPGARPTITRSE